MTLHIREATDEERGKIERLTRARSAPVRLVARARIVQLALQGMTVPAIAQELGVSEKMVRLWLTRFAQDGLAGLDDAARSGRPRTYTEEYYSRVIALARGLPPQPDEGPLPPTCHWTLDRLQEELAKSGVPIKRSQIRRILRAEHIKWQKPRTWLESDDPEFAVKRGPSSGSPPSHRPTAP
jgi:transposase